MAVLSLGMERLSKLTYGLATHDWDRKGTHRIVDLDIECRRQIRDRAPTQFVSGTDPFIDEWWTFSGS